jgi:hypothetical protein
MMILVTGNVAENQQRLIVLTKLMGLFWAR